MYLQNALYFSFVLGNIKQDKKISWEFLCHTEHILNTNSSHKAIPYPNFCRGCNKTYHAGTVHCTWCRQRPFIWCDKYLKHISWKTLADFVKIVFAHFFLLWRILKDRTVYTVQKIIWISAKRAFHGLNGCTVIRVDFVHICLA